MSCQIRNGNYFAPNEEPSILHRELSNLVGQEQANDLFILAYTPTFQDVVAEPLKNNYKAQLFKELQPTLEKTYKTVEKNGFRTIQMFDGKKMLGYIRMKPFRDGMQVEAVNLSADTPKGQGFGTELYKVAIIDTLRKDMPFYSDQAQTEDAQRVWNKLPATEEDGRKKIANTPSQYFDQNGEIKAQKVIEYATAQNTVEAPLSAVEQQEVRMTLLEFPQIASTDDLLPILQKAFYNKGLFNPTQQSLQSSGLYSKFEIQNILNDVELQARIKETVEKLVNTDVIENASYGAKEEFIQKSTEVNLLGKLSINNPLRLEQEIIQEFGGLEEIDLSERIAVENQEPLIEELKTYRRIPQINEDGSPIEEKVIYDNAVKVADNPNIVRAIDAILNAPQNIDTSKVKEKLTKWINGLGLPIDNFSQEFLQPLRAFIISPNEVNTQALETAYNRPQIQKEKVLQLNIDPNLSLVHLETNKSEQQLFEELSLVQTNTPNVYHKVTKIPFEEMQAIMETETASELQMYKDYFGHTSPTFEVQEVDGSFEGDVAYLTNEFIADIAGTQNELLKITEKGIELVSNDPITIETLKAKIKDGMKFGKELEQYSLLSKTMPNLREPQISLDTKDSRRVQMVNNPQLVEAPQGEFIQMNSEILAVKNEDKEFVKVNNQIFELQYKKGNTSYYSRINTNQDLNYFQLDVQAPTTEINLNPQSKQGDFAQIKKMWKNSEINDNFACI